MNQAYSQLFTLLKASINNETQQDYPVDNLDEVIAVAQKQTVDGLLAPLRITCNPKYLGLKLQLVAASVRIEAKNKWMNEQVAEYATLFKKNNIKYAIMKGQTCAYYYPSPLLRRSGDIDVYIIARDFDMANDLIRKAGFKQTDKTMMHTSYFKDDLEVELHYKLHRLQSLKSDRKLQNIIRRDFDEATQIRTLSIGDTYINVLPLELNLLHLTAHAFYHVACGGLGLRQVIDWMVFLRENNHEIDKKKLLAYLTDTRLYRMFRALSYICVSYLGMSMNEVSFDESSYSFTNSESKNGELLLSSIMYTGNFGQTLDYGQGIMKRVRYYSMFAYICCRYYSLCPSEMISWPIMKLKRALLNQAHQRN